MSSRRATENAIEELNKKDIEEGREPQIKMVKVPDCLRPTKETIDKNGRAYDEHNRTRSRLRYSEER